MEGDWEKEWAQKNSNRERWMQWLHYCGNKKFMDYTVEWVENMMDIGQGLIKAKADTSNAVYALSPWKLYKIKTQSFATSSTKAATQWIFTSSMELSKAKAATGLQACRNRKILQIIIYKWNLECCKLITIPKKCGAQAWEILDVYCNECRW